MDSPVQDIILHGDVASVRLSGDVDLATAAHLRDTLMHLMGRDYHKVVLNLSGVAFMDSIGLGVLLGALRRLRERGGEMYLAECTPRVGRLLTLTTLDAVLPMFGTEKEAVAALHPTDVATPSPADA